MSNSRVKNLVQLNLMHKLTLIVVLPLLFEFVFVAALFSLLKLSDVDLARVEKAKQTQSTCEAMLFQTYQVVAASIIICFHHDDVSLASFQTAEKELPALANKLREECSQDPHSLHEAEVVSILQQRLLDVLSLVVMAPSPMSYSQHGTKIAFLTQRILIELARLGKMQANISSHLNTQLNWHTMIFSALTVGLCVSVAISLLVMRFIHADLLRRISVVTDNATKIAKGDQLNQPVGGADEIAGLDNLVHEMNDALVHAEGQRREVVSMLTHDMRVPLTSLAILLDGIVAGKYDSDPQARREKVRKFLPELERVNRMIDDLLTFEKLNAGKLRLIKDKFPLEVLLAETIESLAVDADLKQVHVVPECQSDSMVVADKYQLKRVMINLCENAIKHSPNNTTVTLKSTLDETKILVEVLDEGKGLPEGPADKLFEKYEQQNEAGARKGFGLGLAISKAIIELHGGTIGAHDRADRPGAVFFFSLPRVTDQS